MRVVGGIQDVEQYFDQYEGNIHIYGPNEEEDTEVDYDSISDIEIGSGSKIVYIEADLEWFDTNYSAHGSYICQNIILCGQVIHNIGRIHLNNYGHHSETINKEISIDNTNNTNLLRVEGTIRMDESINIYIKELYIVE